MCESYQVLADLEWLRKVEHLSVTHCATHCSMGLSLTNTLKSKWIKKTCHHEVNKCCTRGEYEKSIACRWQSTQMSFETQANTIYHLLNWPYTSLEPLLGEVECKVERKELWDDRVHIERSNISIKFQWILNKLEIKFKWTWINSFKVDFRQQSFLKSWQKKVQ